MKRHLSALLLLLILMLVFSGCGTKQDASIKNSATPQTAVYHSDISAEDCYLCGDSIDSIIPCCWGQNNIALISLNTFEAKPIEINRYDRLSGRMLEEYAGIVSFSGGGSQNGGFSANMMLEYDRGYATGSLHFYNDETLDVNKAASFLCSDCLNEILPQNLEQCFGVGAIHLATKELRVFEKCTVGFGLGDFYIDCNFKDQEHNPCWVDLLIFYCPIRYEIES